MTANLLTLAISLAVLILTLATSRTWLADPTAHTRYYVACVVMISGILTVISIVRLLFSAKHSPASPGVVSGATADQRRANYRLCYAATSAPLFVAAGAEPPQAGPFSCPVKDISETGLSLLCTGVYEVGQTVHGEVIFASGRTAQINGRIIREEPDRTCLTLHCTIDPSIFMAEQRELIERQRQTGPRPGVSQDALGQPRAELPSHHPKGVCRIK